jgi:hypothetical protein
MKHSLPVNSASLGICYLFANEKDFSLVDILLRSSLLLFSFFSLVEILLRFSFSNVSDDLIGLVSLFIKSTKDLFETIYYSSTSYYSIY